MILLAFPAMPPLCLGSMGAAIVEENVRDTARETSQLPSANVKVYQPWQFKPGSAGGPGRPKGVHNAQRAILRAAPLLAKRYIERSKHSDAICIDARKWILPTDEDTASSGDRVVIFLGGGELPRILPSVAGDAPSLEASA